MMDAPRSGFEEIAHTADWSLRAWAPDLPQLFAQCALGMYWLMQVTLQPEPRVAREITLQAEDDESLLVAFLSELLYLGESEGLGFDELQLALAGGSLRATLRGAPIGEQNKEIKAVTYHNLAITPTDAGYTVTLVFDV